MALNTAARTSAGVQIVGADGTYACGFRDNILVVVWRGAVTWDTERVVDSALERHCQQYPKKVGYVCVVETTASPPPADIRKAGAEMFAKLGDKICCVSAVVEGSGFQAAATRSIVIAIGLLSKQPQPTKVFADAPSAGKWMDSMLRERGGAMLSEADVVATIEAVRAAVRRGGA